MKNLVLIAATAGGLMTSAYFVGPAFGAAGSGNSAEQRNDDFVIICHYDRNEQGPNAGPHTITINANALDHHLENHVKDEGFVGDDDLGSCEAEVTATPTEEPTSEPATATPTIVPD